MIKIHTTNVEDYIAALLALIGELCKDDLADKLGLSERSIRRAIQALKRKRVIIKHRYDDGKVYIRLSTVGAAAYLAAISPCLLRQAQAVIGPDLTYPGKKKVRAKERDCYDLSSAMLSATGNINFIEIDYEPNTLGTMGPTKVEIGENAFTISGTLPFEDAAKLLSGDKTMYLTKRIVKNRSSACPLKGSGTASRIAGILVAKKEVYSLYAMNKIDGARWKMESESSAANYIAGCMERYSPGFTDVRLMPQSIFFFHTAEEAGKMITMPPNVRTNIAPPKIYTCSLIMPQYEISDEMLKLLSVPDWHSKVTRTLFPDAEEMGEGQADAILPNGTEVYNFVGCDYNHIRRSLSRLSSMTGTADLIVQDWMAPYIRELFDHNNIGIVTLNNEHLGTIAEYFETI